MTKAPNISTDLAPLIVDAIRDRKGRDISIVDLSGIPTAAASRFIICQGSSTTQVSSIADRIRERLLEDASVKPYGYDGYRAAQWIVIDYGETLVHVFMPETRSLYDLEDLWADADITRLPDLD